MNYFLTTYLQLNSNARETRQFLASFRAYYKLRYNGRESQHPLLSGVLQS